MSTKKNVHQKLLLTMLMIELGCPVRKMFRDRVKKRTNRHKNHRNFRLDKIKLGNCSFIYLYFRMGLWNGLTVHSLETAGLIEMDHCQ